MRPGTSAAEPTLQGRHGRAEAAEPRAESGHPLYAGDRPASISERHHRPPSISERHDRLRSISERHDRLRSISVHRHRLPSMSSSMRIDRSTRIFTHIDQGARRCVSPERPPMTEHPRLPVV